MSRFVPTRAGIINMWDYRDEEFCFAGGWLVLRGPNGSGKTKALEVLFPFVLDGRIDPKRLNPFAAEDRTMKSNLLVPSPPDISEMSGGLGLPWGAAGDGDEDGAERGDADATDVTYPFLSEMWLRAELRKLVDEFGSGMAERQVADPASLLAGALSLLASAGLVARVDGGVLVLPLLARYRSVTAQIKEPARQ